MLRTNWCKRTRWSRSYAYVANMLGSSGRRDRSSTARSRVLVHVPAVSLLGRLATLSAAQPVAHAPQYAHRRVMSCVHPGRHEHLSPSHPLPPQKFTSFTWIWKLSGSDTKTSIGISLPNS